MQNSSSNPGVETPNAKMLRVTYSTSSIGVEFDQKDTVRRLGLRKLGQTVELPDNPAVRGMLHKVRHLVTVEEA
jgi:large subunit ribosomal protein L30